MALIKSKKGQLMYLINAVVVLSIGLFLFVLLRPILEETIPTIVGVESNAFTLFLMLFMPFIMVIGIIYWTIQGARA